jgi:hypothetical protein
VSDRAALVLGWVLMVLGVVLTEVGSFMVGLVLVVYGALAGRRLRRMLWQLHMGLPDLRDPEPDPVIREYKRMRREEAARWQEVMPP